MSNVVLRSETESSKYSVWISNCKGFHQPAISRQFIFTAN